jgi:hypothetical protein
MKPNKLIGATCVLALLVAAACCKNQDKTVEALEKRIPAPDVTRKTNIDPKKVFSVQRDGHITKIQIFSDFSNYKNVNILRNTTGQQQDQYVAASLPPHTREFEDVLQDVNPYYYWIRAYPYRGHSSSFGPVRVEGDLENTGIYIDLAITYPWSVSRTYSTATITWKFPNIKYQRITVSRSTTNNQNNKRGIISTLEWDHDYVDKLPDPEADYWYWIEAKLENGTMALQGPVKANFMSQ